MRTALLTATAALSLFGCRNDYQLTKAQRPDADLELQVTSPTYGDFLGDEQIAVTGTVSPTWAILEIEGERVMPESDGSFAVSLPVDGPYRIVDVQATLDEQMLDERIPVFSGQNPMATWPGGITGQLLPNGMARLGVELGAYIDTLGWSTQLSALLPGYSGSVVQLNPLGVFHDPTVVELSPADDGMEASFSLRNVTIEYDLAAPAIGFTETIRIGYERIAIGGTLIPILDSSGIVTLQLTDAQIDLDEPIFEFGLLNGWLFDWVVGGINEWVVEPLGEILLNFVLDSFGTFELGGPFVFDLDLIGTPMQIALADLFGDNKGLALELGVGLGENAPMDGLGMPYPDETTPGAEDAHLSLALHEGLFQLLMGDALLPMLTEGLDISAYAFLLDAPIRNLPGGAEAPAGVAWCMALDPGTAYAARLQEDTNPLAMVYLPDFVIDIGYDRNGQCVTWLKSSLAVELGLGLDGTALDLSLTVPEGAVLEYGAEDYDEAEVVGGLGSLFSTLLGTVGGSLLDLDLGTLLGDLGGGILGDLNPEVVGSAAMVGPENPDMEGLYAISVRLWAD